MVRQVGGEGPPSGPVPSGPQGPEGAQPARPFQLPGQPGRKEEKVAGLESPETTSVTEEGVGAAPDPEKDVRDLIDRLNNLIKRVYDLAHASPPKPIDIQLTRDIVNLRTALNDMNSKYDFDKVPGGNPIDKALKQLDAFVALDTTDAKNTSKAETIMRLLQAELTRACTGKSPNPYDDLTKLKKAINALIDSLGDSKNLTPEQIKTILNMRDMIQQIYRAHSDDKNWVDPLTEADGALMRIIAAGEDTTQIGSLLAKNLLDALNKIKIKFEGGLEGAGAAEGALAAGLAAEAERATRTNR